MKKKILLILQLFCFLINIFCDDMINTISLEEIVKRSSSIFIANVLSNEDIITKKRYRFLEYYKYETRKYKIINFIKNTIGLSPNTVVTIAEPYQEMEYYRNKLYINKGIDEGLIEDEYIPNNGYIALHKETSVIVFTIGSNPNDLVYTVKYARETIDKKDIIEEIIKNQTKANN